VRTAARDRRFEAIVGRALTIGITASSLCLAAGLVLSAAGLERIAGLLLSTGLLMLMATPAARIAIAAVVYTRQREWLFAGLTLVVIAELIASVLAALG
jgi:uncharacterized membrane protein